MIAPTKAGRSAGDPLDESLLRFVNETWWPASPDLPLTALKKTRLAAKHFGRYLRRAARVADLADAEVRCFAERLYATKNKPATAENEIRELLRVWRFACQKGLDLTWPDIVLSSRAGRLRTGPVVPFSVAELEQVLAAARAQVGTIGPADAGIWWEGFLTLVLDSGLPAAALLSIRRKQFDRDKQILKHACVIHRLHGYTAAAMAALLDDHACQEMFPWPFAGKRPIDTLLNRFREVLRLSGAPTPKGAMFNRLTLTGALSGALVLDQLDAKRIDRLARSLRTTAQQVEALMQARAEDSRQLATQARDMAVCGNRNHDQVKVQLADDADERTLHRFFELQYRPSRLIGASPATIEHYLTTFKRLYAFVGRPVLLDELDDRLVENMLAWMIERGRSPATANGVRAALQALSLFAFKRKFVDQCVEVSKLRQSKRSPQAWTMDEFSRLIAAAKRTGGKVGQIRAARWWPALLLALYDTSARIGAMLSVRMANVDLERGWVLLRAETQKQDADQRKDFHADTLALITKMEPAVLASGGPGKQPAVLASGGPGKQPAVLASGGLGKQPAKRELLFPCPWSSQYRNKCLKRILKAAGLPHTGKDLFHKIRRTSATHLAAAHGSEMACHHLGHSSMQVTKAYLDVTQMHGTRVADKLPRPTV